MYFSLTTISLIYFSVGLMLGKGLGEELECDARSATFQDEIIKCNGFLFQPVCLICNLSQSAVNVHWLMNNQELTLNKFILKNDLAGNIDVNQCHAEMYSLRLKNPSKENNNVTYSCANDGGNISHFLLKLKAKTKLYFNSTSIYLGKLMVDESDVSVQCVIEGAVPPLSLTWSLNNELQEEKTFNFSAEMFSFEFLLKSSDLKSQNIVTCSSHGKYIIRNSMSLPVYRSKIQDNTSEKNTSSTEDAGSTSKMNLALIASASVILSVVVIYIVLKGILWHRSSERPLPIQNGVFTSHEEDFGRTADPYYYVDHFAEGMSSESDETNITTATCLDTKVSVHGLYEFWTGTFSVGGKMRGKCFERRLSDRGTLHEASEFKLLARRVFALQKSKHIVDVIAINIETEPFSIVYEFLEYGSLRDFVMTRYQQSDIKHKDGMETTFNIQVKELLTFSVNVARGMAFLESQEFCHPFVSLRKVLLTSQCECKLYDIQPKDMAMEKVKKMLKENNPPIAWMTPETIFLCEYEQTCDAWSFSVLLWELFSLGEMPYAGSTKAEIEKIIRNGKQLPQPTNCPGSVYETMLMSWQKNVEKRPTFAVLSMKLEDLLKATQEVGDTEGNLPSTLNPIECGDYI